MKFTDYINSVKNILQSIEKDSYLLESIDAGIDLCVEALKSDCSIVIAGNGGSAADAQHFAGELVSRFFFDRPPLRAVALTTDTSIITATGNDYGYENIFDRQIRALGRKGDVFLALSTSGKSRNVIAAMKSARDMGLKNISLTGNAKTEMKDLSDIWLSMPSDITPHIQEAHEIILHYMAYAIETHMFGNM